MRNRVDGPRRPSAWSGPSARVRVDGPPRERNARTVRADFPNHNALPALNIKLRKFQFRWAELRLPIFAKFTEEENTHVIRRVSLFP